MSRILALIVAREHSKRLPRKNVRLLGGKPLIVHTFEAAKAAGTLDRIVLSTDSREIADLARQHGVDVPFLRPSDLSDDRSPVIDTALHALRWLAEHETYVADSIMLLQPTSPFRTATDINAAVRLAETADADAVVGVAEGGRQACLTRRLDEEGRLYSLPESAAWNRERSPLYGINGALYLVRTPCLLRERLWCPQGATAYVMPREQSVDIDTEQDFALAEAVLRGRLLRSRVLAA